LRRAGGDEVFQIVWIGVAEPLGENRFCGDLRSCACSGLTHIFEPLGHIRDCFRVFLAGGADEHQGLHQMRGPDCQVLGNHAALGQAHGAGGFARNLFQCTGPVIGELRHRVGTVGLVRVAMSAAVARDRAVLPRISVQRGQPELVIPAQSVDEDQRRPATGLHQVYGDAVR
jgi:hypothetical protein